MAIQIIDKTLVQQIEKVAIYQHRTPEQVINDAFRLYLRSKQLTSQLDLTLQQTKLSTDLADETKETQKTSGVSFLLSIAGQGTSEETDVSERDEEILATEIDPIYGWNTAKKNENIT